MKPLQVFTQELQNQIYEIFPKEEYEVKQETINKIQETYQGISIQKKHDKIAICIHIDECYEKYLKGESITEIVKSIQKAFQKKEKYRNIDWIDDYSEVKNRLFLRVASYDPTNLKLKQVPYQLMEDIVMTYHILIDEEIGKSFSCIVTNAMLKDYNVSLEQFQQDAIKSAIRLFPVLLKDFSKCKDTFFKVLTNQKFHNGAATLFYPGIFEQLEQVVKGNFIVIPSSIHEVYIVKDTKDRKFHEMNQMIQDCNHLYCKADEILSNHGYYYDCEYGKLESFDNYLLRKIKKYN